MMIEISQKQAHLRHAKLFLNQLKQWSAETATSHCLESLSAIENTMNNISMAFLRTTNPNQLDLPEMTRDFAIMLFDYYDKRSGWNQWGDTIGQHGLTACERLFVTVLALYAGCKEKIMKPCSFINKRWRRPSEMN